LPRYPETNFGNPPKNNGSGLDTSRQTERRKVATKRKRRVTKRFQRASYTIGDEIQSLVGPDRREKGHGKGKAGTSAQENTVMGGTGTVNSEHGLLAEVQGQRTKMEGDAI